MKTARRQRAKRSYLGKSPDERLAQRREIFLNAAKVVFGDHGFQAAKVRDVCAEAGLTERYYYETFGSLERLYEAIYFRELEVLRQVLDKAAAEAPREPEAMALALLKAYFNLLHSDRRLARILIVDIYGVAPNIKHLYERGVQQFTDRFGLLITLGLKAMEQSKLDAGIIATALVGAASSVAMRWHLGGYREPPETVVANCYAVFLAVIRMATSPASAKRPGLRV